MGISLSDFLAMRARLNPRSLSVSDGVPLEAPLHDEILAECRRRVWLPMHASMAHRTYSTPGIPDFIILCDAGRWLMVECKTKTGKLSMEQQIFHAHASKLQHTVHLVRSFEEFMGLL